MADTIYYNIKCINKKSAEGPLTPLGLSDVVMSTLGFVSRLK